MTRTADARGNSTENSWVSVTDGGSSKGHFPTIHRRRRYDKCLVDFISWRDKRHICWLRSGFMGKVAALHRYLRSFNMSVFRLGGIWYYLWTPHPKHGPVVTTGLMRGPHHIHPQTPPQTTKRLPQTPPQTTKLHLKQPNFTPPNFTSNNQTSPPNSTSNNQTPPQTTKLHPQTPP